MFLLFADVHYSSHPSSRRANGSAGSSRSHHHHHGANTKLASPFATPMLNYSMMDFLMPSNGFTSFSAYSSMSNGSNGRSSGGAGTNGAVKRTSTSTTFVNGKKLMTKR